MIPMDAIITYRSLMLAWKLWSFFSNQSAQQQQTAFDCKQGSCDDMGATCTTL
jgi:hypothetical protein